MVPAFYVPLAELPLGRNGKVNRSALRAPETAAEESSGVGPRTALEARLTRLWEEILGVAPIGVRDDFFELGGHSLLATRLIAEVEKRFGARVPLTALFRNGTIEAMALAVAEGYGPAAFSPLLALKPEGGKAPFFCVHPGGGSVLSYFGLAAAFPADRPFYGLQSPGLDGRVPPLRSVEELAATYLKEIRAAFPRGPYHLGGHSFGGSVAYEMARQLEADGGGLGALVILDHGSPDEARASIDHVPSAAEALEFIAGLISAHFGREFHLPVRELESLSEPDRLELFLQRAREAGLAPPGSDVSNVAGLVAVFQANLQALLAYRPGPLRSGLVLLRTAELRSDDPLVGWGSLAAGEVRVLPIGGDHHNMLRPPHLEGLAGAIAAQLGED
jgi:thioesterase domain-containing protein